MKRLLLVLCCVSVNATAQDLQLSLDEYRDRMTAGWIGQMAGVGQGAPTEFQFNGRIVPEEAMPAWKNNYINQFWQDDLYVEMTFLRTLEVYGWDVSLEQAGLDFAKSRYPLWHANRAGRDNLRKGIAPPDSGHPQFNSHADDIDYQIEADYSGLIAPGMPNLSITLGETFGRIMNYGDGIYGGQFVGAMYAAAFFQSEPEQIILEGLNAIPAESQYAACIRDVIQWWKQHPDDWVAAWNEIEAKYNENQDHRLASCSKEKTFNIDAKINGAYIVMGLLYGEKDPAKTIEIATRCGQDSDCNPSSAAGILFTALGMENIPAQYTAELDHDTLFSHTEYTFDDLLRITEQLARDAVVREGGRIITDANGVETFSIPRNPVKPSPLEQAWKPGPIANSAYTEETLARELAEVLAADGKPDMATLLEDFASGWMIKDCGLEMDPGMRAEYRGKSRVLLTHPDDSSTPCVIWREGPIPITHKLKLVLTVANHDRGDWVLVVKINGEEISSDLISDETTKGGWLTKEVDFAPYKGGQIRVELLNQPNDWFYEAAYWGEISIVPYE